MGHLTRFTSPVGARVCSLTWFARPPKFLNSELLASDFYLLNSSSCRPCPKEYRPALMSAEFPTRPEILNEAVRFAIVASEYNRSYVDGLVRFATDELKTIAPQAQLSFARVPGSFEIPIAVQAVAKYQKPDAILAFGLIFDGETLHASLIASAVTQALLTISLKESVPVLHEVLVAKNKEQATARCLSPELNRGTEAARAAIRIVLALRQILLGG
jgi:6,7-dimethyl-8-ribityllumazine synthase